MSLQKKTMLNIEPYTTIKMGEPENKTYGISIVKLTPWQQLRYLAFEKVDNLLTNHKQLRETLDKVDDTYHVKVKKCKNNCGIVTRRADGEHLPTCTHLPLSVKMEIRHSGYLHENGKQIIQFNVDEEIYKKLSAQPHIS